MKRVVFAVVHFLLVACAWGMDYPVMLVDGRGYETVLNAKPERVLSIAPSATDIVLELQGLEGLVAVSEHCELPVGAGAVVRLPIYPAPSTEVLIGLKPDLILAADITSPQVVEQLRRMGLNIIVLNSAGLDGVVEDIRLVGQALDRIQEATVVVNDFEVVRTGVRAALEALGDTPGPGVLMALSPALDYCVGQGVYADTLIEEAGGRNLGADVGLPWPKLSAEGVLAMNPEVIFILSESVSEAARNEVLADFIEHPRWKEMRAVKRGSVYLVESRLFSVPGTRLKEALPVLFKHLHPELDLL